MSTRLYPIYQKGNPQLRVFLPNFWMKLIRPTHNQPGNVVQFACSMEMTKFDVQNYLEKIYKVPVVEVRTRVDMGKTYKEPGRGYVIKKEDTKIAYVTLVSSSSSHPPHSLTNPLSSLCSPRTRSSNSPTCSKSPRMPARSTRSP